MNKKYAMPSSASIMLGGVLLLIASSFLYFPAGSIILWAGVVLICVSIISGGLGFYHILIRILLAITLVLFFLAFFVPKIIWFPLLTGGRDYLLLKCFGVLTVLSLLTQLGMLWLKKLKK